MYKTISREQFEDLTALMDINTRDTEVTEDEFAEHIVDAAESTFLVDSLLDQNQFIPTEVEDLIYNLSFRQFQHWTTFFDQNPQADTMYTTRFWDPYPAGFDQPFVSQITTDHLTPPSLAEPIARTPLELEELIQNGQLGDIALLIAKPDISSQESEKLTNRLRKLEQDWVTHFQNIKYPSRAEMADEIAEYCDPAVWSLAGTLPQDFFHNLPEEDLQAAYVLKNLITFLHDRGIRYKIHEDFYALISKSLGDCDIFATLATHLMMLLGFDQLVYLGIPAHGTAAFVASNGSYFYLDNVATFLPPEYFRTAEGIVKYPTYRRNESFGEPLSGIASQIWGASDVDVIERGALEQGIDLFTDMQSINPHSASAKLILATGHLFLYDRSDDQDSEEAKEYLQKAADYMDRSIAINPKVVRDNLSFLAQIYFFQQNYPQFIQTLMQIKKIDPDVDIFKDYDDKIQIIMDLPEVIVSNNPDYNHMLGQILELYDIPDSAETIYRDNLDENPNHIPTKRSLSRILTARARDNFDESDGHSDDALAKKLAIEAIELDPSNLGAYSMLKVIANLAGDAELYYWCNQEILNRSNKATNQAISAINKNKEITAPEKYTQLKKVYSNTPYRASIQIQLFWEAFHRGDMETASIHLDATFEVVDRVSATRIYEMSFAYHLKQGDLPAARQDIEDHRGVFAVLLGQAGGNEDLDTETLPDILFMKAQYEMAKKNYKQAEKYLEIYEQQPEGDGVHFHAYVLTRAQLLIDTKRYQEAIEFCQEQRQHTDDDSLIGRSWIDLRCAQAYFHNGDQELALALIERVHAVMPDYIEVQEAYAEIHGE